MLGMLSDGRVMQFCGFPFICYLEGVKMIKINYPCRDCGEEMPLRTPRRCDSCANKLDPCADITHDNIGKWTEGLRNWVYEKEKSDEPG